MPSRTRSVKRKASAPSSPPQAKRAAPVKSEEPEIRSDIKESLEEIPTAFRDAAKLISNMRRPLPTGTGDGTYVATKEKSGLVDALLSLNFDKIDAMLDTVKATVTGEPWDDREYLMERLIKAAAALPINGEPSEKLTGLLITRLWNDLKHPPQTMLGQKHQYRSADGSGNSLLFPNLGAAKQPYARSVKPVTQQLAALPDPGVVFDSVMKRSIEEQHPNKISSMLFYLASIIIHDAFRTSRYDNNISDTSSYLDLSPLYGSTAEEQNLMRTKSDGRIKPDCFSEKRLLGFPPGVGALLIMFNRFHNHVVETLAAINEGGRFNKPAPPVPGQRFPPKTLEQYDEDLFQTGRLVTCGLYINIILVDYVRTILNLHRTNSDWALDPRVDIPGGPLAGTGNQVSAEFNLIYRWHSCISERDTVWTEELYSKLFGDVEYDKLSMEQFLAGMGKFEAGLPKDPAQFPLQDFVRGADGKFADDDLVELLTSSIEDCANSFGPRRVPTVMRAIEIMGIKQARAWNVGTLNELREFFNLKRYTSFDEITTDEYVADQLKRLYDTPDNVEMYPGVVCEDAKRYENPGSGLMAPFTTSRAILSDAVALVRGDRFYTVDYNTKNLTAWGFSEVAPDHLIDHGCVFYKLFLTSFPNHFKYNSVYAHYPLTVPEEMERILIDIKEEKHYDLTRPGRQTVPQFVQSYKACKRILDDKDTFGVTWGEAMEFLMGPEAKNFMLAGDAGPNMNSKKLMEKALYIDDWTQSVRDFYKKKTEELLAEKAYKLNGVKQVDIIRDISNLVHVHFCAALFQLPLKTAEHTKGVFTERELYLIMAGVFTCVFFDLDPEQSFKIRKLSHAATQALGKLVETNVESIKAPGLIKKVWGFFHDHGRDDPLPRYGQHMIESLLESGMSVDQLVWGQIMGTAGGMVPNQGQLFAQVLEYYFTDGKKHWPEIQRWAALDGPEADEKLIRYIMEASRISCSTGVSRKVNKDVLVQDGKSTLNLKAGDEVFLSLYAASNDPTVFPNPEEVKLDRDLDSYVQLGGGPHRCLGLPMTKIALMTVLRVLAKLPNLRPAMGPQGKVAKVPAPIPGYFKYLTETANGFFPFPVSMKMNWDDREGPKTNGQRKSNGAS